MEALSVVSSVLNGQVFQTCLILFLLWRVVSLDLHAKEISKKISDNASKDSTSEVKNFLD